MPALAFSAAKSTAPMPWTGRVLTAIPVAFLLFDTAIKLIADPHVAESLARLGYPTAAGTTIGVLELVCLALYLIPRVALLGAVLLTGYLGGAVASHLRVGDPLLTHILFPIYVAALLWAGLLLRDARLRSLLR